MTGEKLKALREEHGLTRKALAALLGYNQSYIARLEQGAKDNGKPVEITPRFEKLVRAMLPAKKSKKSL